MHSKVYPATSHFNKRTQYIDALKATKINWSDYVLLVGTLLQDLLGSKIEKDLDDIHILYLNNQKIDAITAILKICNQHPTIKKHPVLYDLFVSKASHLYDNPLELDSRRYFETGYAQTLWNTISASEFKSLQKLSDLMIGINPKFDIPAKVNTFETADKIMDIMRQFSEETKVMDERAVVISENSILYKRKNRGPKKISNTEDKIGSSNPGIIRSLSGIPGDERVDTKYNRIVDLFTIDHKKENGYSTIRTDVPYVNSVSGTVFAFAGVLEALLIKHRSEPLTELQIDVDNLTKLFIAFRCIHGYHSLAEMMDVLKESSIQKIVSNQRLTLNLDSSKDILRNAFQKAAYYAKTICLQQSLNEEVKRFYSI